MHDLIEGHTHIVGFQYAVYFFRGRQCVCQRYVMVHKFVDGCGKFAHIRFNEIGPSGNLGRQVSQVGGDNLVKMTFFICFVKGFQTIGEQTEGAADKNASCVHFL